MNKCLKCGDKVFGTGTETLKCINCGCHFFMLFNDVKDETAVSYAVVERNNGF